MEHSINPEKKYEQPVTPEGVEGEAVTTEKPKISLTEEEWAALEEKDDDYYRKGQW